MFFTILYANFMIFYFLMIIYDFDPAKIPGISVRFCSYYRLLKH